MTFTEYFEALWDRQPFPWQEQLAGQVIRTGWPASIGLPTAAGKTALIDIAVYALTVRAPSAARRIFFVVDRRIIVDEAAERAETIADKLRNAAPPSPLARVAASLRDLGGDPVPLATAILRGGIPREDSWADSPLQPCVICSTVDQVGSSLLFRAYGTSDRGRSIRAGLAANDALIILDEAHTSQPFAETLSWIRRYRGWAEEAINLPFTVVEMSATPRGGEVFLEHPEDLDDRLLGARWRAQKRAQLVTVESDGARDFAPLIAQMAVEARQMRDQRNAKVIGVIANRVRSARQLHHVLQNSENCDAILLTGRSRPFDRDRIWEKWRPCIGMDRNANGERPVFVVATQCIEVGANIDFDALVTEIASIDALEQRFGRLNRRGHPGVSHAAIVALSEQTKANYDDPVYGEALPATWKWLQKHASTERRIKFAPMGVLTLREALRVADPEEKARCIMPRSSAPVLLPAHMDLLCQTCPEPALSPEPAVYLHGPQRGPADVQIVWRQDLGEDTTLWSGTIATCPPSSAEAVPLPVWAMRRWLAGENETDVADVEGSAFQSGPAKPRNAKGPVLVWRGSESSEVVSDPDQIAPGATICVPTAYGGCDEWGWNSASSEPARDIADAVKLRAGRPILRLHEALAQAWGYAGLAEQLKAAETVPDAREALAAASLDNGAAPWVIEAVATLVASRSLKLLADADEDVEDWAAIAGRGVFEQESARSCYTREVLLDDHLKGCAEWARRFARELSECLQNTVVKAASLHDIGKADQRFQAWLRGGYPAPGQPVLAKSGKALNSAEIERARQLAGYPKGGRHELLSVALLQAKREELPLVDFDLLLHLIGSHHGCCRPFPPALDDPSPVDVDYNGCSVSSDHALDRAGSGISERFWRLTRRYGWYGLAYLEAVLRLADHRESEAEQLGMEEGAAANA